MKVAYIAAGAGGMVCGSCLHDTMLVRALGRAGAAVSLTPIYTPIRADDPEFEDRPVFYGAVNVYLEQRSALFRRAPDFLRRLLARPAVLRWAGRRGGAVDARALGALTLSMLEGERGRQRRELDELVAWLADHERPEIVHLTNSMLLGMARTIRERLGVPVVCSLQGEDLFLDGLLEPWRTRVREELVRRARDVRGFVVHSRYYAEHMAALLEQPRDRFHVVRLGLRLDGHGRAAPPPEPFTVGYLARIAPEKGFHLAAEAFALLAERAGRERVRLKVAGWVGERDRAYKAEVLGRLAARGLGDRVEDVGEVDFRGKVAFLASLHALSVPTVYREPKGLFALEALANGVPVVLPRHGALPELVEATGGGLLHEPEDPASLAAALASLLDDPARRAALGAAGREAVRSGWTDEAAARTTLKLYRSFVDNDRTD